MPTVTATLSGTDVFEAELSAWALTAERRVADVVARFTGLVAREAQGFAPVDSGRLRSEIVADLSALASDLVGLVVSGAPYSAFVEYGTSRMAAQPFMLPAFEAHARAFYDALVAALS